jgi:hypothetical protein
MESSLIFIPIIIISVVLTLKIIKSPDFRQTTAESKKALIQLSIGGLVGAVLLLSIFWIFLIAFGKTPAKLNPYIYMLPYIASFPIALAGFWLGSIFGLLKNKHNK